MGLGNQWGADREIVIVVASLLLTINAVRIYLEIETLPMSLSPHKPGSAARHQRRSLSANIRVISSPTVWRLHCGETALCGDCTVERLNCVETPVQCNGQSETLH